MDATSASTDPSPIRRSIIPTAFVTGASGLIGRATANAMEADGWTVVRSDRAAPPTEAGPSAKFLRRELDEIVPADLDGCDVLVHVAAMTLSAQQARFGESAVDQASAEGMLASNVTATDQLFRAALEAGASGVVYTSTSGVYGLPENHPDLPPGAAVGSRGPFAPASLYAQTKFLGEGLAEYYATIGSTRFVSIRPTFVYGLDRRTGVPGMFAQFIVDAIEGRPAVLRSPFGALGRLQPMYAPDIGVAIRACADLLVIGALPPYSAINSPTRDLLTVAEMVEIIGRESGNESLSIEVPGDLIPEMRMPVMETEDAFRLLGVDQRFPLAAAVRDMRERLGR